jgi:hypothetical protein
MRAADSGSPQGRFHEHGQRIGCGIEHYLSGSDAQPLQDRMQLARQAMMLTLPGERGERFKVLGLTANYEYPLRGLGSGI